MQFIDHTGHIFSLPHYDSFPNGYEYQETPYIFWIKDDYSSDLSVNCIYIKSIYPIINETNIASIEISCDSPRFKLLSSKTIQEKIENSESVFNINLEYYTDKALEITPNKKSDFVDKLYTKDILLVENLYHTSWYWKDNEQNTYEYLGNDFKTDEFGNYYIIHNGEKFLLFKKETQYSMLPFYVVAANVNEAGTWMTNVLITVHTLDGDSFYCPITVGGTFVDEQEELTINGKNIGVTLPKDICRAFYNSSFFNEYADISLWNQKMKEYLLNHIKLRAERGNFDSALKALKWFGWGDKISLNSLVQTDNEFIDQYVLNRFDLNADLIQEFRYFRTSTYVNLQFKGAIEDKENHNDYDFYDNFWGEAKPKVINLFDKFEEVHYDEGDITFYKPYYDFLFNEIALKLSALKYFYEKYFLPIHLSVYHSTITNQVFANDIKLTNSAKTLITEYSLYVEDTDFDVKFNDFHTIWLSEQQRYIDENWNEHPNSLNLANELADYNVYEIVDNCFTVPIRFISKVKQKYYNCYLICYKDDIILKETHFQFYAPTEVYDLNFVIYPKLVNKNFDINFWLDSDYKIKLMVNGRWYEYDFNIKVPELDIEMGRLVYKYDYDVVKQFIGFDENKPKFNAFMYVPDVVMVENINFMNEYIDYMKNIHMYEISPDNRIFSDNIYYYYYDKSGTKVILSSGEFVLRLNPNTGKYELVRRDLLEILEGMTQDEIDEMFPSIYRYLSTETLINIDSEFGEKLLLDSGKYDRSGIIDIPDGATIYSSLYKNIYNMIDLYQENINIPKNNDFINRIYLFEVLNYKRGEFNPIPYVAENYTSSEVQELNLDGLNMLRFGDNDSAQIKDLYSKFFAVDSGDWDCDMFVRENGAWIKAKNEQIFYDFYLMHDNDYWYGVMISKNPVSDIGYEINYNTYKITDDLYLRYVRYDEKMLINRMEYQSMNNVYHFKPDDFIVARLNNYKNIPFKLAVGSRWTFTPITLKPDVTSIIKSNTNVGIVSIKEEKVEHPLGYYKAKVSYSIDNFLNENQERETKFLVTNEKPSVREVSDEIYEEETPTIEEVEPTPKPTEPPTEEPWDPANKVTPKVNVILYSLNRQETILDFNKDNIWKTSSGKKSVDLFLDFEVDPRYEGDLALRVIIENYIDGYRPFKASTCIDGSGVLNRTNEYVSPGQSEIGGMLLAPTMHDPSISTDLHYDFIVENYRTLKDYRFLFQILDNKYYYGLDTLFDIRIRRLSSEFLKKYPEVGVELVDENKNTIIDLTNFLNRGTYNYKCNLKDKVYKTGKPCYFHVYLVNKFEGEDFQLQYSGDGLMNDFTSETYFPLYEYPEKYPDYIVNWSRDLKTVHSGNTIEQYTVYNFKFKIAENDYFYESSLEYNLNIYYPCYPDLEYNLKYVYEEVGESIYKTEIANYNTESNTLIIDSYISSDSKKYVDDWKLNVKLLNPVNLQASLEYTVVASNSCYNSEKTLEELFNDPSVKRASIGNLASDITFDLPDYPHDYLNNIYVMDNDNHAFILWSRPYIQIDATHRYYFELRDEITGIQKFDLNITRNPNKLYPEVGIEILDSKYSLVKSLSDKFVNDQCYYDVLNRDEDYFLYVYVMNVPEPQFEYTVGFGLNNEEINTEISRKNYIKALGNDSSAFILNLRSLYTVVEDETYLEKFKICADNNFYESSVYTLNVNYPDNTKIPEVKISILNNSLEEIYDITRNVNSMGGFFNYALQPENQNCKEFGPLYLCISLRNIEYGETFTLQYSGKDGEMTKEIELNNLSAQTIFPIYEWPEESLENDIEARYSTTNEYNLSTFKFKIARNDFFRESELSYDITIQRPIYPVFKYTINDLYTGQQYLNLSRYINHENNNENIIADLRNLISDDKELVFKVALEKPNISGLYANYKSTGISKDYIEFNNLNANVGPTTVLMNYPIGWPYNYEVVNDEYFSKEIEFTLVKNNENGNKIKYESRYDKYLISLFKNPVKVDPEIKVEILDENFEKIQDVNFEEKQSLISNYSSIMPIAAYVPTNSYHIDSNDAERPKLFYPKTMYIDRIASPFTGPVELTFTVSKCIILEKSIIDDGTKSRYEFTVIPIDTTLGSFSMHLFANGVNQASFMQVGFSPSDRTELPDEYKDLLEPSEEPTTPPTTPPKVNTDASINLGEVDPDTTYLYIYVKNAPYQFEMRNNNLYKFQEGTLPYHLNYTLGENVKTEEYQNYYKLLNNRDKAFIVPVSQLNQLSKLVYEIKYKINADRNYLSSKSYTLQIKAGKIIQRLPELGVKLLNENYEELNDFSENLIDGQLGFKCFIDDQKYLDKNLNLYVYLKNAEDYENYIFNVATLKRPGKNYETGSYINAIGNNYDKSLCIKMYRNTIDFESNYPYKFNWEYSFDNLFVVYKYELKINANDNFASDDITYYLTIEVPAVIRAKMGFYIVNSQGEILDNLLDEGSDHFNVSRLDDNREYVNIFNHYPCFFEDVYVYGFIENNPSNYPFVLDYYTLFSQTYTGGYAVGATADCNIIDKVFGNEEKNGLIKFLLPILNRPRSERLVDNNPGGYPGKNDSYQREMYGDIPDEISYHDLGSCWCYSFEIVLKPNESFLSPAYFKYDFHFNIGKDPTVYPEAFEDMKERSKENRLIFTLVDYDGNVLDTFSHSKTDVTSRFKCGTVELRTDEFLYEYYNIEFNYPHDNVYLKVTVEKQSMAIADGHEEPLPYSLSYTQLFENGSKGRTITQDFTNNYPLILSFLDTYKDFPKANMEHYMEGDKLMSKFNFEFKLNENYYYHAIEPKSHVIMTREVSEFFIIPAVAIVDEYFGVIASWENLYEFTKSASISLSEFNSKTSKRYLYIYASNPPENDFYYYITFNNVTYKSKSLDDYTINTVGQFVCNSESLAKNNPDYMKDGKYLSEFLIELYNFNEDPLDNSQYQLPITEISNSFHIYTIHFGITSDVNSENNPNPNDLDKEYTLQIGVIKEHTNHKDREGHDFVDDNDDDLCDICGKPNHHDYYDDDNDGHCDECGEGEEHPNHQDDEEEHDDRTDLTMAIKITLDNILLNNLDYLNDFIDKEATEDGNHVNRVNFIIDTSDPTYKNADKLYFGVEFYGVIYGDYPIDMRYCLDNSNEFKQGQFYNYGQIEDSEDKMFVFELDLKSLTSQLPFEISEDGKYRVYHIQFQIVGNEYYKDSELYDIYIQYPIK